MDTRDQTAADRGRLRGVREFFFAGVPGKKKSWLTKVQF
jgi:hypothetical protein